MTILKKCIRKIAAGALLFSICAAFAVPVSAEAHNAEAPVARAFHRSGEEIVAQIDETYSSAKSLVGRRSFYNRCSTLVNASAVVLGLQTELYSCHGKGEYDKYRNIDRTDLGYDVVRYPATEYTLEGALNAISENGTWDVYNIIVGWQGGRSYSSSAYGHTCFIHAIIDGQVYFYESYGLEIGGTYYREGEPIVCSIREFADYYNRWAYFEGAVHFDFPDTGAPELGVIRVSDVSREGFRLEFQASDDIAITDIYAKVWTYGNSQEDGFQILPVEVSNGVATVRVDTAMFDDFQGRYYVACFAQDHAGNVSSTVLEECVCLYAAEPAEGTYWVLEDGTGAYNAPCVAINRTSTLEYTMAANTQLTITGTHVNEMGQTWYLLENGLWVHDETVTDQRPQTGVLDQLTSFLAGLLSGRN